MTRTKLKHVDVIEMSGERLQVRLFGRVYILELESASYRTELMNLLRLLDGRHDLAELSEAVQLPQREIQQILQNLRSMSLTEEVTEAADDEGFAGYCERYEHVHRIFESSRVKSAQQCQRLMYSASVTLLGVGPLADELGRVLERFGFRDIVRCPLDAFLEAGAARETGAAAPGGILVAALSEYAHWGALRSLNRAAFERGQCLVPVYCEDDCALIGPTLSPGNTACLECLSLRSSSNLDNSEAFEAYRNFVQGNGRRYPEVAEHFTVIATVAAHELFSVVTGYEMARSYNGLLRLNLWTGESSRSKVLRFPSCSVCSPKARRPRYDNHAYTSLLSEV
jgi:bacteriocin biosynthesis cyclodehydratase domain-containing protein